MTGFYRIKQDFLYGCYNSAILIRRNFHPDESILFILQILFILSHSSLSSAQKKPEKPPVVERITDRVFRVGTAIVDTSARTVTCPGEINMDAGAVEYLAVAPGGKLHESLLRVDTRPLHLQVALLLLGLEPKNVLAAQGENRIPEGDPVEMRIRWRDENGETREVRAESLLISEPKGVVMPDHAWVFYRFAHLKRGIRGRYCEITGCCLARSRRPFRQSAADGRE